MCTISRGSASSLFEEITTLVMVYGEEIDSRIGKTRHLTNVTLCLSDPTNNMVNLPWRKTSKKYVEAELQWYESADPSVEFISKYAKTWSMIADKDGKVNSIYGYLVKKKYGFDQFEYCFNKLSKNKHDRQSIIHFKWAQEDFGLDTPCTVSMQFMIYKDELQAHTYMRSNDAFYGFCNDIVWFTHLQIQMYNRLKEIYPELKLGAYFHTVGDFHIYEKDWSKIPLSLSRVEG
jgi:thymidylate synthase